MKGNPDGAPRAKALPTEGLIQLAPYDAHLRAQAAMSFEEEVASLRALPSWTETGTVVDLGCGTGAFLQALALAHPRTHFIGVDFREDAIELARREFPAPNLDYRAGRIDVVHDQVDVLMARFCMLYVDDLDDIADWASRHVARAIIQIDNEDAAFHLPPSLEDFGSRFHVRQAQMSDGGWRTAETVTAPRWRTLGFEMEASTVIEVTAETTDRRAAMRELLHRVGEITYGSPLPDRHRDALERWHRGTDPVSYGIRITSFRRGAPGGAAAEAQRADASPNRSRSTGEGRSDGGSSPRC